jgi:hypothetical protein
MTDLRERIQAAINERRALAEAATPGPWGNYGDGTHEVYPVRDYDNDGEWITPDVTRSADASHIAHNDPARILRDCTYAEKVLARHVEDHWGSDRLVSETTHCGWCELATWPCPDVLDLAECWEVSDE